MHSGQLGSARPRLKRYRAFQTCGTDPNCIACWVQTRCKGVSEPGARRACDAHSACPGSCHATTWSSWFLACPTIHTGSSTLSLSSLCTWLDSHGVVPPVCMSARIGLQTLPLQHLCKHLAMRKHAEDPTTTKPTGLSTDRDTAVALHLCRHLCCSCEMSPTCSTLHLQKCRKQQLQYKHAVTIVCAQHTLVHLRALCMKLLPAATPEALQPGSWHVCDTRRHR